MAKSSWRAFILLSLGVFSSAAAAAQTKKVNFVKKLDGLTQPTDIQFIPGRSDEAIVLQKGGEARLWNLKTNKSTPLFKVKVLTDSEQGLLGLAFHPKFATNGRFFINTVVARGKKSVTKVDEWAWMHGTDAKPKFRHTILEQDQPYANHNAGQLAFGPDGFLYIGFGDGGFRDDPLNAGQDKKTWLGKMLRIDVDKTDGKKPYSVPSDNPFVKEEGTKPEIWAWGLRNPWRYSFDKQNRLIVADVGQNLHEEISIVRKGGNYGWRIMEAEHCFDPKKGCPTQGLELPALSYGRDDGVSITGGFVYDGKAIESLKDRYVFADFATGNIWSTNLPAGDQFAKTRHAKDLLFECRCNPSTFGRDADGELYFADFTGGVIYKIEKP